MACCEFNAKNSISFQRNVFGRYVRNVSSVETTLAGYFMKETPRPWFMCLRIIKQMNRAYWKRYCTLFTTSYFMKFYFGKKKKKKKKIWSKSGQSYAAVFVFYLWRDHWQNFRTVTNFMYSSSLSRNTRFLYWYKWRVLVSKH